MKAMLGNALIVLKEYQEEVAPFLRKDWYYSHQTPPRLKHDVFHRLS